MLINRDVVFKKSDSRATETVQEIPTQLHPRVAIREVEEAQSRSSKGATVHILNETKTVAVDGRSPYETYYRKKPTIARLQVLGFDAYVHVHKDTKLT